MEIHYHNVSGAHELPGRPSLGGDYRNRGEGPTPFQTKKRVDGVTAQSGAYGSKWPDTVLKSGFGGFSSKVSGDEE